MMSDFFTNNSNNNENEYTTPAESAVDAASDPVVPEETAAEPSIESFAEEAEATASVDEPAPEPSYDAATESPAEAETPASPVYEPLYSDTSYKQTQQPQAQQPHAQNPYTDPYAGGYRPAAPTYTERPTYGAAPAQSGGYGDGFYHQSFTRGTTGSHVNYTQPAAPAYTPPVAPSAPVQHERRKEKRGLSRGGIALLLIVCILLSGIAGFGGSMLANQVNKASYDSTTSDTMVIHKVNTEAQVAGTEALVDKTTSEITTEVADTVVEITTEVMQTNSFYGQYIAQGAGSGVVISDDGYILTNNHVIEGASSITVTTRGGDSYDATLVGTDSKVDIALLKIDATGLKTAVFGDSSTLEVGSKAVIIGNPLGTLGGSVTEGIISALDRSIVIDGKTMHLMQTDAAINPGNSGGGMFNGQGELAGIVVAKSSSEEIDNIGFVIPINNVLDILGDLKDYGYVRGRADSGMSFIDLTNQMYAWYYYNNSSAGVYISSVENGSNASDAGFREGDRVISVDGQSISEASEVENIIAEKSAGDTVTFELERSGSRGTIELTLEEEVPDSVQSSSSSQNSSPFGGFGR